MPHHCVLIEEPPHHIGNSLGEAIRPEIEVSSDWISWLDLVPERLSNSGADIILPIAVNRQAEAIEFFHWLGAHPIATPVLAVISENTQSELLCSVSGCVDDFIMLPASCDEIRRRVSRLLVDGSWNTKPVHEQLAMEAGLANLLGRHPVFLRILDAIPRLARKGNDVLITGETGTGKELCARAIHHVSGRREFPFIAFDCGAIPDHLIENELFGHARGAFTDAYREQKGLVELAEGGTLFLDEVDSLSLSSQAKLLRLLQERTYRPLGSDKFLRANVKVIAATNQNLEMLVRDQKFRADLYFRLDVLRVHMVPLRERRSDIPLLARHFANSLGAQEGKRIALAPSALQKLMALDWPGNVRQLHNVIARAVAACDGHQILPAHIPLQSESAGAEPAQTFRQAKACAIEAFEREYIGQLLSKCQGNITRAALLAGKERRAFGRLVKRHQLS
jgi:DNA-binding NtrC family response regulator